MTTFVLRRLLHALAVIVVATSVGFAVLHWIPGDALAGSAEHSGRDSNARALLRARYGLDQSIGKQYVQFASGVLRSDLGVSLSENRPVTSMLSDALANSVVLSGTGLILATLIGIVAGSWQGWRPRSNRGRILGGSLTALYATPEFVLAIAIISVFAYRLHLFPVGGIADPVLSLVGSRAAKLQDRLWHLALPALTLALGWGAAVARQQRVALLETMQSDFVRTARAKGLPGNDVFRRHALRPTLPSVVVVIGLMLPALAGGVIVIEALFAWPGMGTLMLRAIAVRDYPLVSGAIIVLATVVTLSTLLADIAAIALDPRRRMEAA